MKSFLKIISTLLAVFLGSWVSVLGATVITTSSSDTLTTFRTNVNTSLTNLNSGLTGINVTNATSTEPLMGSWLVATSTTRASTLYYASTTVFSAGTSYLGTIASGVGTGLTGTASGLSIGGLAGTATALASNPTNCSAGNYPLGIDASGNVESCTAIAAATGTNATSTEPSMAKYFVATSTVVASVFPSASTTLLTAGGTAFYVDSTGHITAKDTPSTYTGALSPLRNLTLSTATTTAWYASTTGAYIAYAVAPFAGTIRQVKCSTATSTAGFLGIDTYIGSTHLTYFVASTTVGTVTFSANNTFTAGQLINMAVGTTTTSQSSSVSCTYGITETP